MITISLCMIVKNEATVLARCLDSVLPAIDELIIVDTGSTDSTPEIIQQYPAKQYSFTWCDDFSKARNYAYSKATMDYQMWLDADDIILPEQLEKLLLLKETLSPEFDFVTMKYHTHFDANGNPIFTSTRERLTKRSQNYLWIDPVHECIPLSGKIYHSDIIITHQKPDTTNDSDRNLRIYQTLEAQDVVFSPRQRYYYARELQDHALFAQAIPHYELFLKEKKGWIEDNIAACLNLSVCYHQTDQKNRILPILLHSFTYDSPRAEICCAVGAYYKENNQLPQARDWYSIAYHLIPPDSLGFIIPDYWNYIPALELCYCYYHLDDVTQAIYYNEQAGNVHPESEPVTANRAFFDSLKQ